MNSSVITFDKKHKQKSYHMYGPHFQHGQLATLQWLGSNVPPSHGNIRKLRHTISSKLEHSRSLGWANRAAVQGPRDEEAI
jgi:hypothetical protein